MQAIAITARPFPALIFAWCCCSLAAAAPLRVVTLSTVLQEMTVRVAGGDAEVTGLVPPGVDPHAFEPSPHDLAPVVRADLVLAAGLELDPQFRKLAENAGGHARIVNLWSNPDPHWWNSLADTIGIVRSLTAELSRSDPGAAPRFAARRDTVLAELTSLERWAAGRLAQIPPAHRLLVTNHDAFAEFAREYGFRIVALSGVNPEAEPSARDLARAVGTIRRSGVKAVFFEAAANPQLIQALADEAGVKVGGDLIADGLTASGPGATFAGLTRHNVETLVDALR